jgi:hypothetical protein
MKIKLTFKVLPEDAYMAAQVILDRNEKPTKKQIMAEIRKSFELYGTDHTWPEQTEVTEEAREAVKKHFLISRGAE